VSERRPGLGRSLPVAVAVLTAVLLAGSIRAWGTAAPHDGNAREAARLIERMRNAPSHYDFTGSAVLRWRVGNRVRQADVAVRDASGSLEIAAGDRVVFDDGRQTYFRDRSGWTSLLIEPPAHELPAPTEHWSLSTRPGKVVAGRPTTLVVVARRDGSPAQRLFVDPDTGLLLAREVLGNDGRVERSVSMTQIDVGGTPAPVQLPTDVQPEAARPLHSVPEGYRAPSSLGAGYELVARSRHPDGILLFYSDGIFSTSVFEQQGNLDWATLPAGGITADISGNRTVRYDEPSGEALVWERDGVVYTTVSDAPSDVVEQTVAGMAGSDRSAPEAVVDFVLGPFGWG
jgi:hypothetical protein